MTNDRRDLIIFCLDLLTISYGNKQTSFEEIYEQLNKDFPHLKISLDEVIDVYILSIDEEDAKLILKNAGF